MSWRTAISAFTFLNLSTRTSSFTSLLKFDFPLPFDLDHNGLASRTFCVALVARFAGSLPRDVDAPCTSTANRAGRRPMYSTALYQLKK
jgi:hypothetical protein